MKNLLLFCLLFAAVACQSVKETDTNLGNPYRPLYHFSPPKNWVNDPNGLVYLDGEYHLFYQHNPFDNVWGHMSWGHAVSKDLNQWQHLPMAIPEVINPDSSATMAFSGCVVVDSLNTSGLFPANFKKGLVAIYTAHLDKNKKGSGQAQNMAYSADKGRTWQFYDQNPVLDLKMLDFRDPNVIWNAEKKVWIMTISKPLEYIVQFYESKNLKKWDLLSEFKKQGDMSRVWECPSLVKVPVRDANLSKWVLMISSGHRQKNYLAMQYFVGDFDGKTFKPQVQKEILYLDEGKDFYAAIPFYNLPERHSKPVIMGWLNDWEYANKLPTTTFKGGFSVPRMLSLNATPQGYRLVQEPIGLDKYQTLALDQKDILLDNAKVDFKGESFHLLAEIEINQATNLGLNLLKTGEEQSVLSYDVAKNELSFDRKKSGNVSFSDRFPSVESVKVSPKNGMLKLQILVDKSVVEIFANDGQQVMTDLVFPTKHDGDLSFFGDGKSKLKSLKIWKVDTRN